MILLSLPKILCGALAASLHEKWESPERGHVFESVKTNLKRHA
jgi:hypothetical protein